MSLLSSATPVSNVSVFMSSSTVDFSGTAGSNDTIPETPPQKQPEMLLAHKKRSLNRTKELIELISCFSGAAAAWVIAQAKNRAEKAGFFIELVWSPKIRVSFHPNSSDLISWRVMGVWWPPRSSKPLAVRLSDRGRFDSYPLRCFWLKLSEGGRADRADSQALISIMAGLRIWH